MRALIVGLGSIGKRHLSNLRKITPNADITVWRQHSNPSSENTTHPDADRVVFSLEEALAARPKIAIIANPASLHIKTGLELADAGVSLLVEKPFSNSIENVEELIELCASRRQVLMIGYNLRFQSSLQCLKKNLSDGKIGKILSVLAEVGQYLPDWRPAVKYSKSVSAQKQLGGGVLSELSHELDYARWLVGEVQAVSAQVGKLSDLEMDVEDIADVHLHFANGAFGSIHLDMLQRTPVRTCKLIGTNGTLTWDGISNIVRLYSPSTGVWQEIIPNQTTDRNKMYQLELKHFLKCVETGKQPLVTGKDGLQVLKIILAAKESALMQKVVVV